MVEPMDMSTEQTPKARKLRETIQSLIKRRSVMVRCSGAPVDYDIVMNGDGKVLLPGMPGHLTPADLEKIGQAILEVVEEAQIRFENTKVDE